MLDEMNVAVSDLIDSLSHAWSELNPLGFNTHLYHPADRYRQLKSDLVRFRTAIISETQYLGSNEVMKQ